MINKIKFHLKHHPLLILSIAIITIMATVLIMQYVFAIMPCKMCYYQRYPYYLILALLTLYFLLKRHPIIFLILIAINLLITATTAGYHVAIERKIVAVAPNCATNSKDFNDTTDLLTHLQGKQAVACDIPAFKLILTLSEWNLLVALLLFFYSLYSSNNLRQQKKI